MQRINQRNSLNVKQIHMLKLMYKFRFVDISSLSRYKGIVSYSCNKSLNILLDQGYVGRHYNKHYKLQGKSAQYYLASKSIKLLRDEHNLDKQVLRAMYKNKSLSSDFVDYNIGVLTAYLNLRDCYPDTFHMFTKSELGGADYFPDPKPSLYLHRIKQSNTLTNDYLLDIFTNSPFFVIKKRIATYLEHFESGDWESESKTSYPTLLFACPDSRGEDNLQRHLQKLMDNAGIDDLYIFTTTTKALLSAEPGTKIWTNVLCPEKLKDLS